MIRIVRLLSAGALLSLLPVLPLGAQEHLVVRAEPGTPVVAAEVLVAVGPADEPEGQEGVAYLTARVATAPIRPILDSLGARLDVQAQKDALAFTLISAPDVWEEATRLLLVALFRDPADPDATARERQAIRAELVGRELNPADAAAKEIDAAVFGPEHPWARPAVGYSTTVGELAVENVDAFLRANFVPARTVMAVVGPVEDAEVKEHLLPLFQGADLRPLEALPPTPADSVVRRDYNSVTTWIVASYRFPTTADPNALHLLADIAGEALAPGPSRRSVYNAGSEVIRRVDGGELRLQVVAPPGEAERWAERIRTTVSGLAERPLPPSAFSARLRRHRGERLRGLNSPEARARAAARELLLGGSGAGPLVRLDGLTAERLHRTAELLEAPVVVYLGPWVEREAPPPEPEPEPEPVPEPAPPAEPAPPPPVRTPR